MSSPSEVEQDPTPDRRVYYRNNTSGDRGWMVKRYGADHVKMDRGPGSDETRPFRHEEWTLEETKRGMNAHEIAQVAFEADKRLCRALGLFKASKVDWLNLHDAERLRWVGKGPEAGSDPRRKRLWVAIVKALTDG